MAKWLKRILISFVVIFIAAAGFLFWRLPSLLEIQQVVAKSESPIRSSPKSLVPVPSKPLPPAIAPDAPNMTAQGVASIAPSETPAPPKGSYMDKATINERIREILKKPAGDIHVCEHLDKAATTKDLEGGPDEKMTEGMSRIFDADAEQDPFAQSWRAPILSVLQRPAIKRFLNDALAMPDHPDEGMLEKAGFYARMATAAADLATHTRQIEEMSDHANHLYVIAKIVAKRPELARDSRLRHFCEAIEGNMANEEEVPVLEERAEVMKLLEYADLKPSDVGFDPESRIKLGIKADKHQFGFSLGETKPELTTHEM